MPGEKTWAQKEAERLAKQNRKARNRGPMIAGGAIVGTAIAGALSSPKVRKGIKDTAKKVGKAVKNTVKNIGGKGDYISNPETGKMERQKSKTSNISKSTKKAIKRTTK